MKPQQKDSEILFLLKSFGVRWIKARVIKNLTVRERKIPEKNEIFHNLLVNGWEIHNRAWSGSLYAFNPQLAQFSTGARKTNLTKEFIEKEVEKIQNEFDFILILEHFDVSLAVLRQKIGWDLADIQYLKINSISDNIGGDKKWLDESLVENFKQLNHGDMVLYDRMNRSLWHQVIYLVTNKLVASEVIDQIKIRQLFECSL